MAHAEPLLAVNENAAGNHQNMIIISMFKRQLGIANEKKKEISREVKSWHYLLCIPQASMPA